LAFKYKWQKTIFIWQFHYKLQSLANVFLAFWTKTEATIKRQICNCLNFKPCDHNPGQWMAKRAQWKQTAEGRVEKSKSISAASCRRSQNSHKFRAFL